MNIKHGDSNTRFYNIWSGMRARCLDKHTRYYQNGIKTCVQWEDYVTFKKDMFNSYQEHCEKYGEDNTSIDRINVLGNYEINNCRWATCKVQSLNRTTNKPITHNNKSYTMEEFCDSFNLKRHTVLTRMKNGWDIEDIASIPANPSNRLKITNIQYLNYSYTITQWSQITNLLQCTIRNRLSRGWSVDRALNYITEMEIKKHVF